MKKCAYCNKIIIPKKYLIKQGKYKHIQKIYNKFCNRICYLANNLKLQKQEYKKLIKNYFLYIPKEFKIWFAGFIDGEGTFSIKEDKNNSRGFIRFSISQKEKKVINYIHSYLPFGKIYKQVSKGYNKRGIIMYVYSINGYAKCRLVYELVKNYIKTTNKINQLNKCKSYFNKLRVIK